MSSSAKNSIYEDLVVRVLHEAGEPLPFREIMRRAGLKFTAQANRGLDSAEYHSRVVRVGGLYALAESDQAALPKLDEEKKMIYGNHVAFVIPKKAEEYLSFVRSEYKSERHPVLAGEEFSGLTRALWKAEDLMLDALHEFQFKLCEGYRAHLLEQLTGPKRKMYYDYEKRLPWFLFLEQRYEAIKQIERYNPRAIKQGEPAEKDLNKSAWFLRPGHRQRKGMDTFMELDEALEEIRRLLGDTLLEKLGRFLTFQPDDAPDVREHRMEVGAHLADQSGLDYWPLRDWEMRGYRKLKAESKVYLKVEDTVSEFEAETQFTPLTGFVSVFNIRIQHLLEDVKMKVRKMQPTYHLERFAKAYLETPTNFDNPPIVAFQKVFDLLDLKWPLGYERFNYFEVSSVIEMELRKRTDLNRATRAAITRRSDRMRPGTSFSEYEYR